MFQKIAPDLLWYQTGAILVNVRPHWQKYSHMTFSIESNLVLVLHRSIPQRLCAVRNRALDLQHHVHHFQNMWEEFQLIDDGWRGAVQLSEHEWVRMQLMWF